MTSLATLRFRYEMGPLYIHNALCNLPELKQQMYEVKANKFN